MAKTCGHSIPEGLEGFVRRILYGLETRGDAVCMLGGNEDAAARYLVAEGLAFVADTSELMLRVEAA